MATQYVYAAAVPNRTLTAKLYNLSLVLQNTAVTTAEDIANTGVYLCTFVEPTAYDGIFRIILTDDATGLGVATWQAVLSGTDAEKVQATEFTYTTPQSGGDATEANQTAILAAISPITTVYTAQLTESTIALIRGDAYDGISNAKLSWTPTKNIDAATGFNFTIRDSKDVVILDQDTTGVTVTGSGTTIEVELLVAATELLDPAGTIYTFDVEVVFSATSHWTISTGLVSIAKDVSRG